MAIILIKMIKIVKNVIKIVKLVHIFKIVLLVPYKIIEFIMIYNLLANVSKVFMKYKIKKIAKNVKLVVYYV